MAEKKQLAKAYEPGEVEDRIYQFWLDGNYFHAEVNPEKKPYTIVIPPPNITGTAAHGPRPGRNAAGHSDPLAADAGV